MNAPLLAGPVKAALLLAVVAAALLALVALFQRRLIYFPPGGRPGAAALALPGAQDVRLATEDGLELGAWFVPAEGRAPAAWVLVLPGNAGHRGDRAALGRELSRRGFSVLLVDYRGYGGNPGRPTERGLALDARAARDWLVSRPGANPRRLIYFGESLGAAVALELAVAHPPALLVLRSPFASLARVARRHYPFLPVGLLLLDRYPSVERAPELRAPLLVVAGERDAIVPAGQSRAVFEAATSARPKRFVSVEGAGHNDHALLAGERMLAAWIDLWCAVRPEACPE